MGGTPSRRPLLRLWVRPPHLNGYARTCGREDRDPPAQTTNIVVCNQHGMLFVRRAAYLRLERRCPDVRWGEMRGMANSKERMAIEESRTKHE